MKLIIMMLAFYIPNSFARPMCQSNSELPYENVLAKNGIGDAFAAVEKSIEATPFKQEEIDSICEGICLNDLETYKLGISVLMAPFSGTEDEKYKKFHRDYFFQVKCTNKSVLNGTGACIHKGESFLKTALGDMVDPIISEIVKNSGLDLWSKDSTDGLSTVEWIKMKCDKGPFVSETAKTYYCNNARFIECRAWAQQPKSATGSKPTNCGN